MKAHQIPNTTMSIVLPVAFVVFMFRYSMLLSVACLVPVIIGFVLLMIIMMGNGKDFVRKYQQASKDMSNAAVEYVRGIPVMKTFGQTAESFLRYKNAVNGFCAYVYKFAISMITADSLYNTAINSVFYALVPTAVILFNQFERSGSTGNAGGAIRIICSFIFFASIIPMEVTILKRIMGNSSESIIVDEAMESLRKILDEKPMEYNGGKKPAGYGFEFKNVSFRYGENLPLALDGINLEISEGKTTALVGLSGGGKSTIASLAARLRDATQGEVLLGGVNIKKISEKDLNNCISIVFQENSLLKMSIADNVALYKPESGRNAVNRALHLAQCDDIIAKLPDGMDTVLGENGHTLSGGERQRLSIARALLKNAPIILLDESTASIDPETETKIQSAIEKLTQGRTVLMIAHRLRSIVNCDKIVVLDEGHVVGNGTHEELMKSCEVYKKLYTLQSE